MTDRQHALELWLKEDCGFKSFTLKPLAGDASFRLYYRLVIEGQSFIVMDAPLQHENCTSFISLANALREKGLFTPEIYRSDLKQGFLLLTDLGDRLYLKELTLENAKNLYEMALDAVCVMQTIQKVEDYALPIFTGSFMRQEMEWFKEWFCLKYLKLNEAAIHPLNNFFDWIVSVSEKQTYRFMHRDYHSANLMVLPNQKVGILDFQDAFIGPVTYDLVSLLKDCYISWPDTIINPLVHEYFKRLDLKVSEQEFLLWFDCMSMQRHLKALMTFSRKLMRDNNANYLQHIPRTLSYLLKTSEHYPEAKVLTHFLKNIEVMELCVQ